MANPEKSIQTVNKRPLLERLRNVKQIAFNRNYDAINLNAYESYVNGTGNRERFAKLISNFATTYVPPATPSGEKAHVLDIAAGTGIISHVLEKEGYIVTATDLSERALEYIHDKSSSITTKQADMNKILPFDDKTFDLTTSVWGNRFIKDTDNFISEVYRILAPGGVFIWPIFAIEQPFWKKKSGLGQHTTAKSLAKDVSSAGFSDVQIIKGYSSETGRRRFFIPKPRFIIAKK